MFGRQFVPGTRPDLRHGLLLGLCLVGSFPVGAENPTQELLTLPRVHRFLAIAPQPDGTALVCADVLPAQRTSSPVGHCWSSSGKNVLSFVASTRHEIQVLVPQFNPLARTDAVKVADAKEPEAPQLDLEALAKLLGAAKRSPGIFAFDAGASAADEAEASCGKLDWRSQFDCYSWISGRNLLTGDDVSGWKNGATEPAGIGTVRSHIQARIVEVAGSLERAQEAAKNVLRAREEDIVPCKAEPCKQTPCRKQPERSSAPLPTGDAENLDCSLSLSLAASVIELDPLARNRTLLQALQELDQELERYEKRTWSGDALQIDTIRPSTETIAIRDVTLSTVELTVKDGSLSRKSKPAEPIHLRVRARRSLAPEVSAAIIHTRLTRPVYQAVEENGRKVVRRGDDQAVDFAAAGTVNFLCRCWGDSEIFPMLQLGTSTGNDVPSFLLGAGLRLFGKTPLSISAGAVGAWIKDLDKLKVGDSVANDLAVQNDLKRRFQVKAYFGIQYKF